MTWRASHPSHHLRASSHQLTLTTIIEDPGNAAKPPIEVVGIVIVTADAATHAAKAMPIINLNFDLGTADQSPADATAMGAHRRCRTIIEGLGSAATPAIEAVAMDIIIKNRRCHNPRRRCLTHINIAIDIGTAAQPHIEAVAMDFV